jgi:ribonuclease PH
MAASLIARDFPRAVNIEIGVNPYAPGSCMISYGTTKVHVTVSVQESVPPFLKGRNVGWLTAEYAMLPGSTQTRIERDRKGVSGRAQEIQRLIGRSLRSIVDLSIIGERTITIDCDVMVADGGTRTAAITGGFVALAQAVHNLLAEGVITANPLKCRVAAISVGINQEGKVIADLNYDEDSTCETDMNVVMTSDGRYVEIQGTAEGDPYSPKHLEAMLEAAKRSLVPIFEAQEMVLKDFSLN